MADKLGVDPAWADQTTPKPQEGIWSLIAPDGRMWTAESPLQVCAAESRERVPAHVALARIARGCDAAPVAAPAEPMKLWLWKNFVDGRPEYWAFDNPFPINLDDGDPQTLGEPCGYALFKPSRKGRTDVSDEQVLRAVLAATVKEPQHDE